MMGHALRKAYWTAYTLHHVRHEARLPFRPLDEIRALQSRRVRAIVGHAYDSVPYYRDVMDAAGLRPQAFRTADDLAHFPIIAARDLALDPQRFLSRRYANGAMSVQSSGTSGYAKPIFYDPAALFLSLVHGHRQRHVLASFVGKAYGYREMHMVRERSVAHQLRAFYESHSWVPGNIDLARGLASPGDHFEDTIARLNAFKPDVVRGYGAHLGALFRFASTHPQLPLHRPKCVVYGADRMADADRQLIEREFGVPVVSTYQAAEALRIGFQCAERKAFHLSIDHTAVRVVDRQGHPVGPGGTGEIVISNLVNRASVVLNYKLGDVVTVSAGPCACGRTLPTIEAIEGRAEDWIIRDGGHTIHGLLVLAPLLHVPGVVQVQLIQETTQRFVLNVVSAPDSHWLSVSRDLHAVLRSTLGASCVVDIQRTDTIAPDASGKFRSVVSRCRP